MHTLKPRCFSDYVEQSVLRLFLTLRVTTGLNEQRAHMSIDFSQKTGRLRLFPRNRGRLRWYRCE